MNDPMLAAGSSGISSSPQLGTGEALVRRVRLLCGLGVSALIFWYVGHWTLGPVDPLGPVSLLVVQQGIVSMAELLGLAVVSSGLCVAIAGQGSADRGPLAVAVGLATLGLRGSQIDMLLLSRLSGVPPQNPFPTWGFVAETWLWLALIGVGLVVGRWVDGWFEPDHDAVERSSAAPPADLRQVAVAVVLTSVFAWMSISFTIDGDVARILKGQVYFSVGISFLLGVLVSHACLQVRPGVWALVSVAVVATAAYLIGGPDDKAVEAARASGGYLLVRPIVRPLPIEYAAMGSIGVLLEPGAMTAVRAIFGLPPMSK